MLPVATFGSGLTVFKAVAGYRFSGPGLLGGGTEMLLVFNKATDTDIRHFHRLDSLSAAQARAIEDELRSDWSIDRIVSSDETLSLLVVPPDYRDSDVAFYICAERNRLNLSIMENDDLQPCGTYIDVDTLLLAIRRLHRQ